MLAAEINVVCVMMMREKVMLRNSENIFGHLRISCVYTFSCEASQEAFTWTIHVLMAIRLKNFKVADP